MYHIDNPDEMAPEQIFNEIANILSKGFIRLKQRQLSETKEKSDVSLDSFEDQSAHEHRS
ncbi:MAG: hypothetical protein KJ737_00470 [Proteobacteria bacterium]|nr:hypothetical protein [Pseudomonadota bacterium]